MIRFPKYITIACLLIICLSGFLLVNHVLSQNSANQSLWQYQCIDTMKISRDRARSWKDNPNFAKEIAKEVATVKSLGANCIAIGTPYDEEFIPFLKLWVAQARKNNLHVWFRGNFSSWEGWFSYPKGMTTQEHLQRTKQFILSHQDLFENGDIFTPAPEAENGWGTGYVPPSDYPTFRQFLIDEHTNAQDTFSQIGKNVVTNWLSMSGGLARDMLDQPTITALDNTVTIDHYVKDPATMKDFIDYFHTNFNAKVVIGEFGAPIPDLNGSMTEQEQTDFVSSVFHTIYQEGTTVYGVNYWVLNDGSTALIDQTGKLKQATHAIQYYYKPANITGNVTDELGDGIPSAHIVVNNGENVVVTNDNGQYSITTPVQSVTLDISKENYKSEEQTVSLTNSGSVRHNIVLKPVQPSLFYNIRLAIKNFF